MDGQDPMQQLMEQGSPEDRLPEKSKIPFKPRVPNSGSMGIRGEAPLSVEDMYAAPKAAMERFKDAEKLSGLAKLKAIMTNSPVEDKVQQASMGAAMGTIAPVSGGEGLVAQKLAGSTDVAVMKDAINKLVEQKGPYAPEVKAALQKLSRMLSGVRR